MRILLVYPEYPDTFWSFRHALRIASKRASLPPLGLLTVAAMLPRNWEVKLVDMNVGRLKDKDIERADYVFLSAMAVQRRSVRDVIGRCRRLGTRIVAGGPLFTAEREAFADVDHLVLGEAENTVPHLVEDLQSGRAKPLYDDAGHPDISRTPVPEWSLIDLKDYTSLSLQYSRGCPYDCEFCDVVVLNGREPRLKSREQVLNELEAIYRAGWRDGVFIVDDNFIGNRRKLKEDILPAVAAWQGERKNPFMFFTEASINLADDDELMRLMVAAGFNSVFIGIESPHEESLVECNKSQNRGRDLIASVKRIQENGFQVQGGFVLGFDSDPANIFERQVNFIQRTGIVTAMVSLLNAPRGTRLYERLRKENRLLENFSGDNTDCSINFVPRMDREALLNGYRQVLTTIYSSRHYYDRVRTFLEHCRSQRKKLPRLQLWHVRALLRSIWFLGVKDRDRLLYWHMVLSSLFRRPRTFPLVVAFAIYGFHFRTVVRKYTSQRLG
ncbi:MAG: B12-binding domain-containing radical SAM protein [Dehalococcoidia bacterium]|nr:B12-binding domain-containing radical SAM protein [Dehalococcoidia bacterium]